MINENPTIPGSKISGMRDVEVKNTFFPKFVLCLQLVGLLGLSLSAIIALPQAISGGSGGFLAVLFGGIGLTASLFGSAAAVLEQNKSLISIDSQARSISLSMEKISSVLNNELLPTGADLQKLHGAVGDLNDRVVTIQRRLRDQYRGEIRQISDQMQVLETRLLRAAEEDSDEIIQKHRNLAKELDDLRQRVSKDLGELRSLLSDIMISIDVKE